ncbi:MAG: AzlC family ABC transporter permease [Burkholderiales bacterium]|jgi:predicted branched-subunit amino acid permease|nr:AzlC family ABC transporter permease [Burkholderiales bacterium]
MTYNIELPFSARFVTPPPNPFADDSSDVSMIPGARAEFLAGVQAEMPLLLGIVPFGLIFGVLGLAAGLPAWAVMSMSVIVLGGSSQIVFVQLWGVAAPFSVIGATVGIVNLRHLLYSADMAPYLSALPWRWKCVLSYLLTDEAYMVAVRRFRDGSVTAFRHWYLLGTGLTLWTGWVISTIVGVFVGRAIPDSWSLEFSIALTFIALLVLSVRRKSEICAALASGAAALALQSLPHKLWILAAAAIGMVVGLLVHRWWDEK